MGWFIVYLIILYYVMLCCWLLEVCSFLIRDRKGVVPEGRGGEGRRGEGRGGEELGQVEGGENSIQNILSGERNYFHLIKGGIFF
jgi:hypothetical protein